MLWDMMTNPVSGLFPTECKRRFNLVLGPTGFDMWRTRDGVEWFKVTDTGFGEHDNSGVRNFLSTR